MALAALIVARACGYDFGTVGGYLAYFALYVGLPGVVAMYFVNRGALSIAHVFALALPTGFALEIFTYLGLAALGAKSAYAWMPLGWALLAAAIRLTRGHWPVRVSLSGHHAGVALALCITFLGTVVMAASQMFSESPLADGLPTRAIFHDWVYLVSRAGVIKNHWPLDDPSLSGTPLQYHYFMMVHAAAASWTTGVEISTVMLRLLYVPLGAALVAQAYVLGRAVSRSPWGGVLAAVLTVMAGELSFAPSYGETVFLGLFGRWLFVSPTFFFGMVFCGALLIAIARCSRLSRWDVRHGAWLMLLGLAATGAKGTVVPVVVVALGLWAGARWWRERRFPVRPVLIGVALTLAFFVVYAPLMSAWRTGDAAFRPFHVFGLASFWKHYLPASQQWLAHALPGGVATLLTTTVFAVIVFAGTCGVGLLAIPFLWRGDRDRRDARLVGWMGAFFAACAGMGLLMELNSYGELYVLLMMRLPMAVLSAGFLVAAGRRLAPEWRALYSRVSPWSRAGWPAGGVVVRPWWIRRWLVGGGSVAVGAALGVQAALWGSLNAPGFREFLKTPTDLKPDGYMRELQDALLWVRENTERHAVLVSNACTVENMRKDHWGALDCTLTGVHFYYSALSERRLWFEGPNYIMDTTRARLRASLASNFFYRGVALPSSIVSTGPTYILLDRSLADGAKVGLALTERVFSNARLDVYRLTDPRPAPVALRGPSVAGATIPLPANHANPRE